MGYALRLPDVATELLVSRLSMSRGELWGELTVSCAMPAIASQTGHISRGRFNISSPTARATTARLLRDRTAGADIEWAEVLETLCVGVLSAESAGTPFQLIGRMPVPIGATYLLEPILPLGKPTILFGDGGVGKSFFAVGASVSVATGQQVIADFNPRQAPVLYLDWETDAADIDGRVKAVSAGIDIEPPEIGYRACAGALAPQIEEIARYVEAEHVGLVIVDSMAGALGSNSEASGDANESVVRMFTALRHLSATVLVLDHVSKEGASNERGAFKPYGSAYKVNLARSVWELRQGKDPDGDTVHLGLYHRKANNSRLSAPIGLAFRNESGRVVTWQSELITEVSLEKGISEASRIWAAISKQAMTADEIADETGIELKNVRVYLSRGLKAGRYGKGAASKKWSLLETRHAG